MKVILFSADGAGFVADAEIPPFETTPDVIVWGTRYFVAPGVAIGRQDSPEEVIYIEAFSYVIPS
jgi:hypothetical protein